MKDITTLLLEAWYHDNENHNDWEQSGHEDSDIIKKYDVNEDSDMANMISKHHFTPKGANELFDKIKNIPKLEKIYDDNNYKESWSQTDKKNWINNKVLDRIDNNYKVKSLRPLLKNNYDNLNKENKGLIQSLPLSHEFSAYAAHDFSKEKLNDLFSKKDIPNYWEESRPEGLSNILKNPHIQTSHLNKLMKSYSYHSRVSYDILKHKKSSFNTFNEYLNSDSAYINGEDIPHKFYNEENMDKLSNMISNNPNLYNHRFAFNALLPKTSEEYQTSSLKKMVYHDIDSKGVHNILEHMSNPYNLNNSFNNINSRHDIPNSVKSRLYYSIISNNNTPTKTLVDITKSVPSLDHSRILKLIKHPNNTGNVLDTTLFKRLNNNTATKENGEDLLSLVSHTNNDDILKEVKRHYSNTDNLNNRYATVGYLSNKNIDVDDKKEILNNHPIYHGAIVTDANIHPKLLEHIYNLRDKNPYGASSRIHEAILNNSATPTNVIEDITHRYANYENNPDPLGYMGNKEFFDSKNFKKSDKILTNLFDAIRRDKNLDKNWENNQIMKHLSKQTLSDDNNVNHFVNRALDEWANSNNSSHVANLNSFISLNHQKLSPETKAKASAHPKFWSNIEF